jgi:RNA polymerase subunit RPABC4/transcription elongation factor Spt4
MVPCVHCGKLVGRNFTFCPFCLGHLRHACRNCGRAIDPKWKGCPDCGTPI